MMDGRPSRAKGGSRLRLLALLTCCAVPCAIAMPATPALPAPTIISRGRGTNRLRVAVTKELALTLLEADVTSQASLVDLALEAPSSSPEQDPYGVVLWPAAQVSYSSAEYLLVCSRLHSNDR